jgi:hypothetical protein
MDTGAASPDWADSASCHRSRKNPPTRFLLLDHLSIDKAAILGTSWRYHAMMLAATQKTPPSAWRSAGLQ